jgi:hypothetical protein
MSHKISSHIRSNVVGYVALFFAFTGGAYAVTIAPKNSVVSSSIKNRQVKKADLGAKAVVGSKLANNAVTGTKVAPNSLTGTQINETTLDPAVIQDRVTGTCGSGQAVASIDQGGSVGCHGTGAGATDIALGGGSAPPSSPLTSVDAATTTVNVSGSGKVLAFGMPTSDYIPSCFNVGCVVALGLYVDGTPVPGSREERSAAASTALGTYAPVQGLATGISPGSHTVVLKLAEVVNSFVAPSTGSATVSAIAPGV